MSAPPPAADSVLWLVWKPMGSVFSTKHECHNGTSRLFRTEAEARAAFRSIALSDYYDLFDGTFGDERDRTKWVRDSPNQWKLRDESAFDEAHLHALVKDAGFLLAEYHVTAHCMQVSVEATDAVAVAKLTMLRVATVIDCTEDGHRPMFKVAQDRAMAQAWLDGKLRERIMSETESLRGYERFRAYVSSRRDWWLDENTLNPKCDELGLIYHEFMRFKYGGEYQSTFDSKLELVVVECDQPFTAAADDADADGAYSDDDDGISVGRPVSYSDNGDSDIDAADAADETAETADRVWLLCATRGADDCATIYSDTPCMDVIAQLFSAKTDALAVKRSMLLAEYYKAADAHYDGRDTRETEEKWVKRAGKWVLFHPHMMEESEMNDFIQEENPDHHEIVLLLHATVDRTIIRSDADVRTRAQVGASAAAPAAAASSSSVVTKRKEPGAAGDSVPKLWVAWTMACCPEDETHDATFRVCENEDYAKAWLDDQLRVQVNDRVDIMGETDTPAMDEFVASSSGWVGPDFKHDADAAAELGKIATFCATKNIHNCPFSFGIKQVAVDAHRTKKAEAVTDKEIGPEKKKAKNA